MSYGCILPATLHNYVYINVYTDTYLNNQKIALLINLYREDMFLIRTFYSFAFSLTSVQRKMKNSRIFCE